MANKKGESNKMRRLIVLDSHAILHRAYHAIPELSSSKGEPTGALYGLVSMLLKIIQELKPNYIVAARDLPGKTKRHDVYEAYKATRMKADDALIAQLSQAPHIFEGFGIPVYAHEGYEADDVAGTIAEDMKSEKNIETVIVTGDADLLQLVSDTDHVAVYRLLTGLTQTKLYDEAAVEERYGFAPPLITDLKGIMGDASDNIKGVPGVGEGSAQKLVQTFGDLDSIYRAIKKEGAEAAGKKAGVQKRFVQLVADNEESARFSKTLATIDLEAPIRFSLPKESWNLPAHLSSISDLCDEFEFRSLKERARLLAGKSAPSPEPTKRDEINPRTLKETSIALWLLHSDTSNPSEDDILSYAKTDDFEAARKKILHELQETGRLEEVFKHIEQPLIPVTERMNVDGVFLDVAHLKALEREYKKTLGAIAGRIYTAAGHEFNIGSPKQLGDVLYDELGIGAGVKQKKTSTGARTTREAELAKLAPDHEVVADVLVYRELQKLLGTYVEKLPALVDKESRLHAQFVQAGTTTGRMSSQDPNLQNIPIKTEYGRRIRSAFAAPRGRVIASLDYSQIELRIAAGLSGDERLIEVFKEGGDVHAAVASAVFHVPADKVDHEMRRRAKVINFGILYGMGANALRQNLGGQVSREEAARYLDEYFKKYDGLARYVERIKKTAAHDGYTETLFGRRRYFSGFNSTLPGLRAQAERMAVNAPLQGTQADIIKLAMVEADTLIEKNGWREKASLVMQVHDELVYELDAKAAAEIVQSVREVMEHVAPKKELHGVPIIAEAGVGPDWGDLKKIPR